MLTGWEQALLLLMVFGLMVGIGCSVEVDKFKTIFEDKKSLVLGLFCQYFLIPTLALLFINVFKIDPKFAPAFLLIASCPGGTTSNMFSYFSKAHIELSIFFTTLTSLLAFIITPLLYKLFSLGTIKTIEIPLKNIAITLIAALLPIIVGLFVKLKSPNLAVTVEKWGKRIGHLSILSMIIIWIPKVLEITKSVPINIYISISLLSLTAMICALLFCSIFGLAFEKSKTISFETGIQNAPLAFAILGLTLEKEIFHQISWVPLLYGAMSIGAGILMTLIFILIERQFKGSFRLS